MATVRYEVDLYQINVSKESHGDCAILLLVKKGLDTDAKKTPPAVGTIVSTVIIDGGNSTEVAKQIQTTVAEIERTYTFTTDSGRLKYDAVVVTHWDGDHMNGINRLFYATEFPSDWVSSRNVHLKYNAVVVGDTTTYTPLTNFFAQSPWPNKAKKANKKAPPQNVLFNINANFVFSASNNVLLGRNIFNGTSLNKNYSEILNLNQLVAANDPWNGDVWKDSGGAPGLYIAGANQTFLGNTVQKTADGYDITPPPENSDAILESGGPTTGMPAVIDSMNSSDTNLSSLVMLLVWKSKTDGGTPKVSLYTGGDAEYPMENMAANFMMGQKIQFYKAGHHGSKAGTSATFIKAVQPDHILYSAGTKHGHPVPECILYLDAWLSANPAYEQGGAGSLISKRLHAVCYPYQLGVVKESAILKRPIENELTDPDVLSTSYKGTDAAGLLYQQFTAWLVTQYKILRPDESPDPIAKYTTWLKSYVAASPAPRKMVKPRKVSSTYLAWQAAKMRYLVPVLTEMWDKWSKTTYNMFAQTAMSDWGSIPDCLIVLDYVYVTFSYEQSGTNDYLESKVSLCKIGSLADVSDKPLPEAKAIRLNNSDLDAMVEGYGSDELEITPDTSGEEEAEVEMIPAPSSDVAAPMGVTGINSNPFLQRLPQASASFYLSLDDEKHILANENPLSTESINDRFFAVPWRNYVIVPIKPLVVARAESQPLALLDPLLPSKLRCSIGPTGTDTINFATGSDADAFLTGLRGRCLTLDNVQRDPQNSSNILGQLSANDFLNQWLGYFFASHGVDVDDSSKWALLSSTSVGCGNASPQTSFMMELTVNWPGSATTPIKFASDSASVKQALNITSDVSSIMDASCFMVQSTGLVLGLEPLPASTTISTTLGELCNWISIDLPVILDGTTNLTLDTSTDPAIDVINAIWICPDDNQSITARMTFVGDTSTAFLIVGIPGLKFVDSRVIATKNAYFTTMYTGGAPGTQLNVSGDLCIKTTASFVGNGAADALQALACDTFFELSSSTATLLIRFAGVDQIDNLLAWMALSDGPGIDVQSEWQSFKTMNGHFNFALRELLVAADHSSGSWKFYKFQVTFEVDLPWGAAAGNVIPMRMTFSYRNGSTPIFEFNGYMWDFVDQNALRLTPSSAPYPLLMPSSNQAVSQNFFSLLSLLSTDQQSAFPTNVLPTAVTGLNLTIGTQNVAFSGKLIQDPTNAPPSSPTSWISLDSVYVSASYDFSTINFDFRATILLYPRAYPPPYVGELDIEIQYNTGAWSFSGTAMNINLACLASWFPDTDSDAVMNVLEQISLLDLEVDLSTSPTDSESKSFDASGSLQLGDVILSLDFARNTPATGQGNWSFTASLEDDFELDSTTIGDFLGAINPDMASMLPDVISAISFGIPTGSSIVLDVTKESSGIIFGIVVDVGDFEFAFAQISNVPQTDSDDIPQYIAPKRIFKFAMDKLPDLSGVPLLDKLSQPFDQMDFFWASDNLLRQEVEDLNAVVFRQRSTQLVFIDPIKTTQDLKIVVTPGTPSPGDTVILQGCHFQVVVEQNNVPTPVVDYCFAGSVTTAPSDDSLYVGPVGPMGETPPIGMPFSAVNNATTTTAAGSATGKWTKTIGPLTICSISLKLQNGYLYIMLDAKVMLGPVGGNVKGFGIGIPLASNLHSIDTSRSISIIFSSIGIELNRPPVELAGELRKVSRTTNGLTVQGFEGGLVLGIETYTFVAGGGYYDKVTDPKTGKTFKSLFVFAELDGPIAELELGSLSDLTGGIGYNSQITLPNIDNVTTFPFIATNTRSGSDPLSILDGYLNANPPWFTPADGPLWFAIGITANALSSLTVKSVAVLDLSSDVKFGIYADAQATFPAGVTDDAELFARVDMGLLAEIEPSKGIFHAEGQLTPKSFIMSQACHLTGGFALCLWYEGSGHSGDWVFTIGGYHPAYQKPMWYPRPVRLAISWQYDSNIYIHGEAYFAITPKVCMGGGKISLQYVSGSLQAYFDAWLDFLINYKPFSFSADIGITIKVHYTCEIFWVSTTFDLDLGASAEFSGPPIAGVVHVTWHIISFDILFGNANPQTAALTWNQFYDLLLQLPDNTPPTTTDVTNGQGMHTISPTSGVLANTTNSSSMIQQNTSTEVLLVDKATFSFSFTSSFPITSISYGGGDQVQGTSQTTDTLYIKPMHVSTAVTSQLTITITGVNSLASFTWSPIYKQVPIAVWGAYSASTDVSAGPLSDSAMSSQLDPSGGTCLQCMGVDFDAPEPNASTDTITFNIQVGSAYSSGTASLPGPLSVPTIIGTTTDLDASMNVSAPLTPTTPYNPYTILGRAWTPKIATSDLLNAWIKWNGVDTNAPLGARLATLGASTGIAPSWLLELQNSPTQPLPVLTAEASVKALAGDGTRFATWGQFRGTGPMLNRDWLDAGFSLS